MRGLLDKNGPSKPRRRRLAQMAIKKFRGRKLRSKRIAPLAARSADGIDELLAGIGLFEISDAARFLRLFAHRGFVMSRNENHR